MTRTILGIDPGVNGALAWYSETAKVIEVLDVPVIEIERDGKTRRVIDRHKLTKIMREHLADLAWIEQVHSSRQMSPRSAFSFGNTFGSLCQAVVTFGIPLKEVSPVRWKPEVGIAPGSDKSVSRARAKTLFPAQSHLFDRAKDDGRAEAGLIAWWGARQKS